MAPKSGKHFKKLSELATKLNMTITKYFSIRNKLFALDRKKKRLVICEENNGATRFHLINLQKIKSIMIKKAYGGINAGELREKRPEEFLKFIHLQFEDSGDNIISLSLYEKGRDDIKHLRKLEIISKRLQSIFSLLTRKQSPLMLAMS